MGRATSKYNEAKSKMKHPSNIVFIYHQCEDSTQPSSDCNTGDASTSGNTATGGVEILLDLIIIIIIIIIIID